jgi:hypothetical protein
MEHMSNCRDCFGYLRRATLFDDVCVIGEDGLDDNLTKDDLHGIKNIKFLETVGE